METRSRVALVTGATRGIGKGIVLELAQQGYEVWFTGRTREEGATKVELPGSLRSTAAEAEGLPGRVRAVACDHADDAQTRELFDRIDSDSGRLDLLVNNVWGGYEYFNDGTEFWLEDELWKYPLDRWDTVFRAGPRAHFFCSQLASKRMAAQGGGTIATISYWAGQRVDKGVAYSMAKAACDHLTRTLAHELRRHNIACLGLYPGLVRTEGVLKAPEGFFDFSNSESPRFTGRAVAALDQDPKNLALSGSILTCAQVALDYHFTDIDGKQPVPLTVENS
jgi:dehydrogenase/reductase SDR family member 1